MERIIKLSNEKISVGQACFLLALAFYIFRNLIRNSLLIDLLPSFFSRSITIFVLLLLITKLFCEDRYPGKLLVIAIVWLALVMAIVLKDNYSSLVMIVVLIASSYNVNFESILKWMAIAICISSLIVVISCAIGIIPDYTYSHDVVSFINVGHSLGFKYYSTVGYIVMTLSAIFLYFHRKCRYISLLLLALINCALFAVHTTTLSIIVGLGMIVVYIFTVKIHWLKFKNNIWRFIATILMPVCFFLNLVLVILYGNDKMGINASFLYTLKGRFDYSIQALNEYGVHWFGSKVEMFGRTLSTYGDAETSFYIDSAYMYMLIAYGILFTIVIIVLYMILSQHIYKMRDPYLFAWFAMIVVICMINNFILSYVCNPFLFLIPSALMGFNRKRNINCVAKVQENVSTQC